MMLNDARPVAATTGRAHTNTHKRTELTPIVTPSGGDTIPPALAMFAERLIPLKPGIKWPAAGKWQVRPAWDQRRSHPTAHYGVRLGRGLVVVDADEKNAAGTRDRIRAALQAVAGDLVEVETPTGGGHFYFRVVGDLAVSLGVKNSVKLPTPEAGELRYGMGAYVVAPYMRLPIGEYRVVSGDLNALPELDALALIVALNLTPVWERTTIPTPPAPAIVEPAPMTTTTTTALTERRKRRYLENALARECERVSGSTMGTRNAAVNKAAYNLARLAHAGMNYQTAYDVIMAAAASVGLVREDGAKQTAQTFASGWRAGLAATPRPTPDFTTNPTTTTTTTMPAPAPAGAVEVENIPRTKALARALAVIVRDREWPGRTGAVDRAVMRAHCDLAEQGTEAGYYAGCRDLAERAGIGHVTATRATARLIEQGWLAVVRDGRNSENATMYVLLERGQSETHKHSRGGEGQTATTTGQGVSVCHHPPASLAAHDAFRWAGLGKASGEVYGTLLQTGVLTPSAIADATGRGERTVVRALARMIEFKMVEKVADGWRAVVVDLDDVARELGTAGTLARQKFLHKLAREGWKDYLNRKSRQEHAANKRRAEALGKAHQNAMNHHLRVQAHDVHAVELVRLNC